MIPRVAIFPLLAAALCCAPARAGDADESAGAPPAAEPRSAPAEPRSAPLSAYPDRWSIKSYLARERPAARIGAAYRARTDGHAYPLRSDAFDTSPAGDRGDRVSLLERLISLESLESLGIATLWRGRDRALVIGIQDGGYLGVRLDDPDTDGDEP